MLPAVMKASKNSDQKILFDFMNCFYENANLQK